MLKHLPALIALCLLGVGCGGGPVTHVRFATASSAEIQAARESNGVVWYDFEAGDEVPIRLGILGVAEAVTDPPIRLVTQRPFSVVVLPNGQTYFSFDRRRTVMSNMATRWTIGMIPGDNGGEVALITFIGLPQDLPQALQ